MARINIEDEIFKDHRFIKLMMLCEGDVDKALGSMFRAWMLAQKWWLSPTKKIPLPEWEKAELNPAILASKMAVLENGFVYVRGSREQFAWLDQRSESGRKGGIKSGETRSKPKQLTEEIIEESPKRDEAGRSGTNPPSLSLSLSPSLFSFSNSFSGEKIANEKPKRAKARGERGPPDETTGKIWDAYSGAYRQRYGVDPVVNARVRSQIKLFASRLSAEEAPWVAEFYVFHNAAFYVKCGHTVGPMLADAESLRTQWATGRQMTSVEARGVENRQSLVNAFQGLLKPDKETC